MALSISLKTDSGWTLRLFLILAACLVIQVPHLVSACDLGCIVAHESLGPDPEPPEDPEDECEGDPVSPYSGKWFYKYTDLTVKGLFPIVVVRQYDSQSRYDSPLGYGWAFNYDKRLYKYPDGAVIVRRDCGVRDKYIWTGNAYTPPLGVFNSLAENPDGSYTLTQTTGALELYDAQGRLTTLQDPQGNRLEMSYDVRGKLPLTGSSPYAVDPATPSIVAYDYRLTKVEERLADGTQTGHAVNFNYDDPSGRIVNIQAADGRQVVYQHDTSISSKNGNLIQVTGLENLVSTFQYNDTWDAHNATSVQVSAGTTPHVNVYEQLLDRVLRQTHGNDVITFTYPDINQPITHTVSQVIKDDAVPANVLGTRKTEYIFSPNGYADEISVSQVSKFTYRTKYFRDSAEQVTRIEFYEKPWVGTEVLKKALDYTYDTMGNKLTESTVLSSGETVTTTWTYDHGWMASEETVSSARPAEIFRTENTFFYAANGYPSNIKTERRLKEGSIYLVTSYTYDANGRVKTTTLPDGHKLVNVYAGDFLTKTYHEISGAESPYLKIQYGYDAQGNRNQITDAKNQITQVEYDDIGRITKVTNPLNEETNYRYTNEHLTEIEIGTTVADGEGQITRLNYSPDGYLESIDRKDDAGVYQRFVTYTLDSRGKSLTATDAVTRTTTYTYDALGRLLTATDPLSKTTEYKYDYADNRIAVIDAKLIQTDYRYDELERLYEIEQHGVTPSALTQMAYDAVGNLLGVTDPENHTTSYVYDRLSRNTRVTQPLGQAINYIYDDRGRLDYTVNARLQKLDYDYEEWGPIKEAKYYPTFNSTTADRTITYSRDFNGNITGITDDAIQVGSLYTFTHDALNRPDITTIKYLPGGDRLLDNDYDRFGNRDALTVTDGGALTHAYTYNKLNRLESTSLPGGQAFGFGYYDNDDIQTITYPNGINTTYTYKANGPVLDITVTGTSGNIEQFVYTYDDVLNVDTLTDLADGLHDFSYDNLSRLTQALHPTTNGLPASEDYVYDGAGNRENPANPADYQYDENNRITASPGLTYSFDDDGNTTGRSDGAVLIYTHDNRLESFTKGATSVVYSYDPMGRRIKKSVNGVTTWYLWDGDDLVAEYDSSGIRTKRYAYLPKGYAPIQVEDAGGIYNLHSNHLDTPTFMTGPAQQVVWRGRSQAFGNTLVDGISTVEMNVRFPGQYYDQETGLHYNYFRYYDPSTGRYITSDPIGLDGGLNTYSYVNGNPLNFFDSLGLYPSCERYFLDSFNVVTTYNEEQVLSKNYGFAFVITGPTASPSPDPRRPRRPPITPSLRTEVWWALRELLSIKTFEKTKTFNKLKVFCTELLTDECGNTREFNTVSERTELVKEIEKLTGEKIETREQLIRLLFVL